MKNETKPEPPKEIRISPEGIRMEDLLILTPLCGSRREAREYLQAGLIRVGGVGATPDTQVGLGPIRIERGKRDVFLVRVTLLDDPKLNS